eukprot:CAMPEP_0197703366 /NCGR_PEP_ID=MMETSP1338-20131121/125398_1 /TAXON_ID=43686 ORGANISM="Pelagodinium beii, Strain RCC1491" /NCGR_SAMPLE_ID=MMETSP1338 /ASSEMBLY_ACC=CAM_ASM_000754 /LENGTH=1053 /DNA_ID=CAMNT_0043287261 /DNA_START=110 /DNA_END=3272 /DNA_ORIENTATION=+
MAVNKRSASSTTAAALGAAGVALLGGSAFVASSSTQSSASLRATVAHGASQASTSQPSSTGNMQVGFGTVATASLAAFLTRGGRPAAAGKITLQAFESELGVQAPVGFWDPLGLARDGDVEAFQRRRSVELKHGRIAMLATMGYITPEVAGKFPGFISPSENLLFEDVPNGLAAISKVPGAGWTQILLYMGWCEVSRGAGSDIASGRPGDFGWYVLTSEDAEVKKSKLNAELANGRLAMMAIIGMFYQDGLTGSAWGDWANYTESPLRAFENELGVQAPVGFFDPLGLSKDGDAVVFKRRRVTELKNGRVAMIATLGYIVPEYVRFPGACSKYVSFSEIPNGLAAFSKLPEAGAAQIFLFIGFVETFLYKYDESRAPGDYANGGVLGVPNGSTLPEGPDRTKRLNSELANGRLAMMAIIGMFFQDGLTGSAWGDWALYTDSPLRAFESELGVQAPVGYFDPLGLSKDGDKATFMRRRSTELKHGRISMLAAMGYMTPEITGKFPGYLSYSQSLKFADIPNGLGAISKVPAAGWLQIIGYMTLCENTRLDDLSAVGWGSDIKRGTPGDYGFKVLTASDEAGKQKKLNAELANGRLAMMAIIGMFFQDGLTGSAWGDWANYTDSPLRAFENELGVQAPVGYFDPLGLSKDGDAVVFKRRRVTELKNGRVAMIATLGYIVPEYVRFPGACSKYVSFSEIPNGLAAFSKLPEAGAAQIFLFIGFVETFLYKYDESRAPGDYANGGVLGVPNGSTLPEGPDRTKRLNSELANGRLAMMAIIGMFFQDGLTGSAWGDWALYTDSPLRAFESELGVQAPVGYFDPLGLSKDGDKATFMRRRSTELKHGRISMLAAMGYMTPEITGKFPGYLSYSQNLKFADIPNGLGALSKVPGAGWLQIAGYMALCENTRLDDLSSVGWGSDIKRGTPGDFGFKVLTSSDPAELKKKLNAELANGRLAMMAIIGMFFQDGLTGSAWGDWANYTDFGWGSDIKRGTPGDFGFKVLTSSDPAELKKKLNAELANGRLAMMAIIGMFFQDGLTGSAWGDWANYTDSPLRASR